MDTSKLFSAPLISIRLVMDAMSNFKNKNFEIKRFEFLVKNFKNAVHLDVKVKVLLANADKNRLHT